MALNDEFMIANDTVNCSEGQTEKNHTFHLILHLLPLVAISLDTERSLKSFICQVSDGCFIILFSGEDLNTTHILISDKMGCARVKLHVWLEFLLKLY